MNVDMQENGFEEFLVEDNLSKELQEIVSSDKQGNKF